MARKVLFDVDPGCDDAVMLAMALGHDDIEVVGLTTVAGNAAVDDTTRNALSILELGGRTDVPVARGCARPLVDDLTTAEWVHGEGGIRGAMPDPSAAVVDAHAAEFLVERARDLGGDLTVAAVGPPTNLAVALALEPALPELVGEVVLMGGEGRGVGNVTPAAEANFHNDPAAASRVVQEAFPTVVALDVTSRATVHADLVAEYAAADGPLRTVGAWLDYPEEVAEGAGPGGAAVHDAVVAAYLLDESAVELGEFHCEVDTTGGPSHGALVCDYHGVTDGAPNARVATDVDEERYRALLEAGVEGYLG